MSGKTTHLASLLCSAAIIAYAGSANAASAQEANFDIAPQPLATALNAFSEQSQLPVIFKSDLAQAKVTAGISGEIDAAVALDRLLAGTGLSYKRDGNAFVIVQGGGSGPQASSAGDGSAVDALIVTAQKREENIQDVPIAISAFSQEALEAQKIEGGFDLLKAIPNVTFSKNNYSGYNFSIRGVGTKSISATSDAGVAVAFNNTSLIRNRLFEQEYLDIERVEVLRGPQGTLYGRNATSGVVNMVTAKPDLYELEGRVKLELGNYDAQRASVAVNLPLIEGVMGLRIAGASTEREGYGYNQATGDSVDGRDLWTGRVSLAFQPFERLRADVIWERFEEDDNRLRTGKQLCHRGAGPSTFPGVDGPIEPLISARLSQGCKPGSLYEDAAFGAPNGLSIPFIYAAQLLGQLGYSGPAYNPDGSANDVEYVRFLNGIDPYGVEQSRDLRTISSLHDAEYRAKADILSLDVSFDLTDTLTLTSQTLYNEDQVYSFQDYHRFALVPAFNDSIGLYKIDCFLERETCGEPSEFSNFTPGGVFNDPQIGPSDSVAGFEISSSESTQFSQEFRLQSDFDGPFNFSGGVNYTRFKGLNDYYLFFNVVTMLAQGYYNQDQDTGECSAYFTNCMTVDPNPIDSLNGDGHNYFRNRNPYKLESKAAFGEVYWEATDTLKVTAGLRFTDDRKSFTPWRSQLLVPGYEYGASDPVNQRWTETTGRLGVDWRPELPWTDETMVYAFYSRGYKGGGANPPPARPINEDFVVSDVPATFDPEFVDAFEIGAKNTLLGGAVILNGAAFFYDYNDYQVSKVVDRTIVNENFDAKVWGAELEAVWRPMTDLRVKATLGYLNTEIAGGEQSIDIFNRTQGREGWSLVTPWIQQTSNCILPDEVLAPVVDYGLLDPPATFASPIVTACLLWLGGGVWLGPDVGFMSMDASQYPDANMGAGFYADLGGNELPNAPHWTFNIGAEYRWDILPGWEATVRGDYYRQSDSYARVYNLEADRLKGWDNTNVSLRLERPDRDLAFELYAKNVFDETPITDAFINSDSTGMTTNVFVLDPRLVGVSITKAF